MLSDLSEPLRVAQREYNIVLPVKLLRTDRPCCGRRVLGAPGVAGRVDGIPLPAGDMRVPRHTGVPCRPIEQLTENTHTQPLFSGAWALAIASRRTAVWRIAAAAAGGGRAAQANGAAAAATLAGSTEFPAVCDGLEGAMDSRVIKPQLIRTAVEQTIVQPEHVWMSERLEQPAVVPG